MTRKDYITFAKFHGDFIYSVYAETKTRPQDVIYIDRLLKNHLISIFKTDNGRFDIGRYKNFIFNRFFYVQKTRDAFFKSIN